MNYKTREKSKAMVVKLKVNMESIFLCFTNSFQVAWRFLEKTCTVGG